MGKAGNGAAARRALKKARREARRREAGERERQDRAEWTWWYDGLGETPTGEIVAKLSGLGVQTDEAPFRELAQAQGSVDAIAEAWEAQGTATGRWVDYYWMAGRALWARWTPDLFSIEVFIQRHLPPKKLWGQYPQNLEEAERHWKIAQAIMDLVAPREGPPRPDLMERLDDHAGMDVGAWLLGLPFSLASLGRLDEALEIGARMSPVCDTRSYLSDRAVILAEAGRRDEALRQVQHNLAAFPGDVWVHILAGDAHKRLGDVAAAEAAYRRAMAVAEEGRGTSEDWEDDRADALDRLLDLLDQAGREADADALLEAEQARLEASRPRGGEDSLAPHAAAPPISAWPDTVHRAGPQVGRNDPCPCGSGKKYKRCCAR